MRGSSPHCRTRLVASALALMLLPQAAAHGQSYGRLDTSFELSLTARQESPLGTELAIATTTVYPCAGYQLASSVRWNRDTLTVAVLGLRRPSPCVPMSSIATASLFLGDLGDTTVVLCFTYRGNEDRYRIVFSRTGNRVIPLVRRFTSFRR